MPHIFFRKRVPWSDLWTLTSSTPTQVVCYGYTRMNAVHFWPANPTAWPSISTWLTHVTWVEASDRRKLPLRNKNRRSHNSNYYVRSLTQITCVHIGPITWVEALDRNKNRKLALSEIGIGRIIQTTMLAHSQIICLHIEQPLNCVRQALWHEKR